MRSRRIVLFTLGMSMAIPILFYFWISPLQLTNPSSAISSLIVVIAIVAILAIVISVAIGIVAQKVRNIKLIFVSLAYASLAAMVLLHGLALPELLNENLQNSYIYAQLSLVLSTVWLWLSALSADHRLVRWLTTKKSYLLPTWCALLVLLGTLIWVFPDQHFLHFMYSELGKRLLTLTVLLFNTWVVYRHLITYMASRFSIQLAIVYSTGWMNTAQIVLITTSPSNLGWWGYHILLFLSVIAVTLMIIGEYKHAESLSVSVKRLYRADPDSWIQTYLTPSVKDLVLKTETKDAYTAGHNYRVTVYALKLGEELGLSSSQLRSIAQGGLVHDVGKLHIPDYVLNKPGKLTDSERQLIEKHPVDGYNMCKQVGFMIEELAIIRSHHEKWNGTGYPDHLVGEDIPLVARVTAVADVYDALTSSRSYRKAMSHEKAMVILIEESGSHFDPECIEAWKKVVEEEKEFFDQMLTNPMGMKRVLS
ncbi:HD-GYP domain-containing protein [Paenibacillus endoradicis]|uniref:HD-GYP domain-containing protein n=1 Tax=Paenibacillus endoradicis TaxID=2972487 RepID=UPI00215975D8|nr:HD domain-containing phosphohydrolase [Paenibacillus endoradicis]MCR8660000.1 HD domain-containing protein [Paenibacillus endoradicis]